MPNPYDPSSGVQPWAALLNEALDRAWDRTPVVFNVKDSLYGAQGDGVTDDTAAIKLAITAASLAGGGTLYFPPGTYLLATLSGTAAGLDHQFLPLTTGSLTIQGHTSSTSVLKVANGVAPFFTVFGGVTTSTDLTGLVIRDLGFDMNTANNAANSNQSSGSVNDYRAAVVVYTGSRVTIRGCRITDSCGVWGFAINGATVADTIIEGNRLEWASSAVYHDTSAVYTSGVRTLVRGNHFSSTAGTPLAFTAIETHGDDQVITDNTISGWFRGANLTGVAAATNGIVFAHNVIKRCAVGVELWSSWHSSVTTGFGLVNTSVHHNEIDVDYDAWPVATITGPRAGVMVNLNSNYGVKNLDIRANQINWRAITTALVAADLSSSGIALYRALCSVSLTGGASAATGTTITTTTNIPASLAAFSITITGGTGSGQTRTISSNTTGANAVITVSVAWTTNPDATSTWSITGAQAIGTASAGTSTTITTTLAPTVSLAGYTVRITAGTGVGQERMIASNTTGAAAVLTVSSAWATTPDATSVYALISVDQNITVTGNKTVGSPGPGIFIQPKSAIQRLQINDNVIVNPASNAATNPNSAYRVGVKVYLAQDYVSDLEINRNLIIDDRETSLIQAGIDFIHCSVAVTNGNCIDNDLRVAEAAASVPTVKTSATAGTSVFVRHKANKYVGTTNAAMYGSQIIDVPNGVTYTQTTAPSGTTWSTSSQIAVDVQTFTSSGTWTKPSGASANSTVEVVCVGGGSGGGSGRRGASGTVCGGGGGGAGGGISIGRFTAGQCSATETVTIGAGGAGGAAVTADSTDGNAGTAGGTSSFGSKVRVFIGSAASGGAGSTSGGTGALSTNVFASFAPGAGGNGSVGAAAGSNGSAGAAAGGGGGGGGLAATPVFKAGGSGGNPMANTASTAGAGGATDGAGGSSGVSASDLTVPYGGGGGGGGASSATGAGGTGGSASKYGGGGGGGGASLNTFNSGAGGSGAAGFVQVITTL